MQKSRSKHWSQIQFGVGVSNQACCSKAMLSNNCWYNNCKLVRSVGYYLSRIPFKYNWTIFVSYNDTVYKIANIIMVKISCSKINLIWLVGRYHALRMVKCRWCNNTINSVIRWIWNKEFSFEFSLWKMCKNIYFFLKKKNDWVCKRGLIININNWKNTSIGTRIWLLIDSWIIFCIINISLV